MKENMTQSFKKGKEEYKNFIKSNKRLPTSEEWSKIAKEKGLPSTVSMRYMCNIRYKKGTS